MTICRNRRRFVRRVRIPAHMILYREFYSINGLDSIIFSYFFFFSICSNPTERGSSRLLAAINPCTLTPPIVPSFIFYLYTSRARHCRIVQRIVKKKMSKKYIIAIDITLTGNRICICTSTVLDYDQDRVYFSFE